MFVFQMYNVLCDTCDTVAERETIRANTAYSKSAVSHPGSLGEQWGEGGKGKMFLWFGSKKLNIFF